jgi:hypothetical protein
LRSGHLFPSAPCAIFRSAVPSISVMKSNSSFERRSSSERLRFFSSPEPFSLRLRLPLGFCPSWRHHSSAATIRATSRVALCSVRRFSQPLDGLFRSRARGLIPSRCHVQGLARSRASLPAQPLFLVGRSLPPCRCCTAAHVRRLTFAVPRSRPRAVPLDFEASICAGPRSSGSAIHLARGRSLPRAYRSSRINSRLRLRLTRGLSLLMFAEPIFALPRSSIRFTFSVL